jgi:hypothetical protein
VKAARLLAAVLAGTLALAGTGPASADEARDKLEAQQLFNDGNRLAGEGEYLQAVERFRAAYARYPSPKILLNVGTMLRHLGRNVEAAEVYESYLRDPGGEPARAEDLRRILREIDLVVGHLEIAASEEGAQVRLDDKQIVGFKNGKKVRVEPGEHTLTAEHPGFAPAVRTVRVAAGQELRVVLDFTRPPERRVVVERPPSPLRTAGWVTGGIGAAGIVAGGAAGVVAMTKNSAAAKHCLAPTACDPEGVALGNTARTSGTVSTVAFTVGGVALAAGIVLVIVAPRSPPAAVGATRLVVAGGPGGGLVALGGAL